MINNKEEMVELSGIDMWFLYNKQPQEKLNGIIEYDCNGILIIKRKNIYEKNMSGMRINETELETDNDKNNGNGI